MSLITRKQKIIKRFVNEIETSAELTFTDDEGLFKIDMTKYPLIKEHLMVKDEMVMGWIEANKTFKLSGEFGYTFWDRGDRVYFHKSYEDDIVAEKEDEEEYLDGYVEEITYMDMIKNENVSARIYKEVEAESIALLQEFEDQVKKQITYYQDIGWDIKDCEGLKENLKEANSKDFWDNNIEQVMIDVDEEIDIDMFEAQVNNMRAMLDRNPSIRRYSAVQDGLRELWNDFNRKDKQ